MPGEMSFDRLAPHYRWMESVLAGRVLQKARTRWLDELRDRRSVLIVGEGPGRTLEELLPRFPRAEVTVVEASAGMIGVAQRRLRAKGASLERVRWIQADVRMWEMEQGGDHRGVAVGRSRFDVVITPFVLDCFSSKEVDVVVDKLVAAAASDAIWLVADFQVPAHGGWRERRAKAIHALMYWFFRVATDLEARRLTRPDEALGRAGFVLRNRAVFSAGLVHSDLWERRPSDTRQAATL